MLGRLVAQLGTGSINVLTGRRGTGKTQLAANAAHHAARAGAVLYTKAMQLFLDVRRAYQLDGVCEADVVSKYIVPRLLIIDEAHERGDTAWEDRVLAHIVDRRYDAMCDTLLICNMKREAIIESLGPSIASRIQECGAIIECNWESFRKINLTA